MFFVFPAAIASKASSPPQQSSLPNNVLDAAVSQGTASQHAMENYFSYSQQPGEYPQVGIAQPGASGIVPELLLLFSGCFSPASPLPFYLFQCSEQV